MALRRMRRPRAMQQAHGIHQATARRRFAKHAYGLTVPRGRVTPITPVKPQPRKGG
jgi:hypothetical protein